MTSPKIPKPQPTPTPPQKDPEVDKAEAEARARIRARRGFASTIATEGGAQGLGSTSAPGSPKTLLGGAGKTGY